MKSKLYVEVGKRIHQIRSDRGYTRSMLAKKAEISEKFLYEIETGKKGFSSEILYRIANVLGASCDYILCGKRKKGEHSSELMALIERFDEKLGLLLDQIDSFLLIQLH